MRVRVCVRVRVRVRVCVCVCDRLPHIHVRLRHQEETELLPTYSTAQYMYISEHGNAVWEWDRTLTGSFQYLTAMSGAGIWAHIGRLPLSMAWRYRGGKREDVNSVKSTV